MNFLGHLYFSNNDVELMYANIFGDFVRGKDLSRYTPKVQYGIRLHRTIDHYIDHHPAVVDLLHTLYTPLPKIAGIAIDVMFDHLLAKNWEDFHDTELELFLDRFHQTAYDTSLYDNDRFHFVIQRMREKRWIYHYSTPYGLQKACEGLSKRISFENELSKGYEVFLEHEEQIEKTFRLFMSEAIPFYKDYFAQNKL